MINLRRPALHRSLRLGYLSFWDPDEATYAETTREMLASHSWLVPTYVTPFFDKSPLFYLLRMATLWRPGEHPDHYDLWIEKDRALRSVQRSGKQPQVLAQHISSYDGTDLRLRSVHQEERLGTTHQPRAATTSRGAPRCLHRYNGATRDCGSLSPVPVPY